MGANPDSERGRSEAEDAADGSEGGRHRERTRARLPWNLSRQTEHAYATCRPTERADAGRDYWSGRASERYHQPHGAQTPMGYGSV